MKSKKKNVLIEHDTFILAYSLVISLISQDILNDYPILKERALNLDSRFGDKLDRLMMHDMYTQSKIADTHEEREKARLKYLSWRLKNMD